VRARAQSRSGQTAAEYLGVLLVVAALVAAVAGSGLGHRLGGWLSRQVCAIGGGDCAAPAAPVFHAAFIPARRRDDRSPCGLTALDCLPPLPPPADPGRGSPPQPPAAPCVMSGPFAVCPGVLTAQDGDVGGDGGGVVDSLASLVARGTKALAQCLWWRICPKLSEQAEKVVERLSGLLQKAQAGRGNFGVGQASAEEAQAAGRAWVGDGYRVASDGKTLVSADGLRAFRPPSFKPKLGIVQANFEQRAVPSGPWSSNGHVDVTLGP
jgi:hypothetical protein